MSFIRPNVPILKTKDDDIRGFGQMQCLEVAMTTDSHTFIS